MAAGKPTPVIWVHIAAVLISAFWLLIGHCASPCITFPEPVRRASNFLMTRSPFDDVRNSSCRCLAKQTAQDPQVVGDLIRLAHDPGYVGKFRVRTTALDVLRDYVAGPLNPEKSRQGKCPPGYEHDADLALCFPYAQTNEEAVEMWDAWWEQNRNTLYYDPGARRLQGGFGRVRSTKPVW